MATFAIVRYDKAVHLSKLIYSSHPQDPNLTNEMRRLFEEEPKNGYTISYAALNQLITKIDLVDPKTELVGLAILPGKTATEDSFNIALEGIRYKRIDPTNPLSKIEKYSLLDRDEYFGAISKESFAKIYTNIDKKVVRDTIIKPDPDTTIIVVDRQWLTTIKQLMIQNVPLRFVFGRSLDHKRLTVILIGQLSIGRIEETLHLDDHDLIPPPDVES